MKLNFHNSVFNISFEAHLYIYDSYISDVSFFLFCQTRVQEITSKINIHLVFFFFTKKNPSRLQSNAYSFIKKTIGCIFLLKRTECVFRGSERYRGLKEKCFLAFVNIISQSSQRFSKAQVQAQIKPQLGSVTSCMKKFRCIQAKTVILSEAENLRFGISISISMVAFKKSWIRLRF